jgi:hypothetical protein
MHSGSFQGTRIRVTVGYSRVPTYSKLTYYQDVNGSHYLAF